MVGGRTPGLGGRRPGLQSWLYLLFTFPLHTSRFSSVMWVCQLELCRSKQQKVTVAYLNNNKRNALEGSGTAHRMGEELGKALERPETKATPGIQQQGPMNSTFELVS